MNSNWDIRNVIPLLRQFGINPDQLGPQKIQKLIELTQNVKNHNDITPELSAQMMDIMGMSVRNPTPQGRPKRKYSKPPPPRIGRNQLCPCGSGKKFKKCCMGKQ